jgi:hypothetical protein
MSEQPESDQSEFPEIAHLKKRAFLSAFAVTGTVAGAAKASAVSRRSHSGWMKDDPKYAAAFLAAQGIAADALEQEARRRATDGLKRFKFHKGSPIIDPETKKPYFEHEYSDTLLIFLLKGNRPEKFGDQLLWNRIAKLEEQVLGSVQDGK